MSRSALRNGIYAAGGLLAAAAALLLSAGCFRLGFWVALWAALLIVGLLVERWRYQPLTGARPGPDWVATDERFVDPETGKLVTVYYHPSSGERRYVAV
jgi:hypothetical protein